MKKILSFAASTSSTSINKKLAQYTASQVADAEVNLLNLNDYDMPLYSTDTQAKIGMQQEALNFLDQIKNSDAIVISFAEHNGNYAAAFKNILDWASRENMKVWQGKPMFLLATSPGGRGGQTVLSIAENYFPFMGAEIKATFSLPSFHDNFSEDGITNPELKEAFSAQLKQFEASL